jgi:hypothetical protein
VTFTHCINLEFLYDGFWSLFWEDESLFFISHWMSLLLKVQSLPELLSIGDNINQSYEFMIENIPWFGIVIVSSRLTLLSILLFKFKI